MVLNVTSYGKRISLLRRQQRMSQKRLAEILDTTQATVSKLEGDALPLTEAMAARIALALDTDMEEILQGVSLDVTRAISDVTNYVNTVGKTMTVQALEEILSHMNYIQAIDNPVNEFPGFDLRQGRNRYWEWGLRELQNEIEASIPRDLNVSRIMTYRAYYRPMGDKYTKIPELFITGDELPYVNNILATVNYEAGVYDTLNFPAFADAHKENNLGLVSWTPWDGSHKWASIFTLNTKNRELFVIISTDKRPRNDQYEAIDNAINRFMSDRLPQHGHRQD